MGLIKKEYINDDCLLGIWEITEDYDILFPMANLDDEDLQKLNSFGCHKRKLEWLSVRILLRLLTHPTAKIIYNKDRKPFLNDKSYNISISHSNNFTSILLSKTKQVGIDLEFMSHEIKKIARKFLNEEELNSISPLRRRFHIYIHWCAKEALYKICDKQNINFRKNLSIKPFKVRNKGILSGTVHNESVNDQFSLNYSKLRNYVIVWCYK